MIPAMSLVTSRPDESEPPPPPVPVQRDAFPAGLVFALTAADSLDDDVKIDRATDGTGRAQSFYIGPKHRIDASLIGLSASDWDLFDLFYREYRAQAFTIPWGPCDSPVALPVMFSAPPKRTFLGNGRSTVTFQFMEFP